MKQRWNKLSALFFTLVMLLVFVAPSQKVFANSTPKHITIIHTNDTHSRVEMDDKGGLIGFERIASLVKQAKAENPNTLVLDAGDTLHGQTFATISKGESIIELMNIIGYDAMAPGNHDFNYGQDRLLELKELMTFPLLAANIIKDDGTEFLKPYEIKEIDGVKIAIFGLATPETAYKTSPNNVIGLTFQDPAEAAQKIVNQLKDKVDVIVALSHLGLDESSTYRSDIVAEKVSGIDIIIDGHSHTTLQEGKEVNETLIVQAGEYGKNLGYVDLYIEDGKITKKTAKLSAQSDIVDIVADQGILDLFAKVKEENSKITSVVVGKTPVKLEGERENVRTQQTNLGSVVADAMLHQTGADIAITNGGGLRASIDEGEITKGDIITVLPFGNYVKMIEVKGSTILEAMERGVSKYPETDGGFPQVGGMTYKFDASKPANERIVEILIKGEKLDLNKTYKLATNDFMSIGGDNYTMFKDAPLLGEFPGLDEATIEYIAVIGDAIPSDVRGTVVAAAPIAEPKPEPEAPKPSPEIVKPVTKEYIVKVNDVLWKVAREFGLTYETLAQYNNLKNPHLIFPGQKLLIPVQ